jgi:peptidoglycan-associated lipoprotein
MRRALCLALTSFALALTACPSPPKNGECKTSKDCESQAGFGKVCVSGRCSECAADSDCKPGFVCTDNACQPRPAASENLPTKAAPKPECSGDTDCSGGMTCQAGKCAVPSVDAACADASAFTVHFGFDQASITGDAPDLLKKLAACLQKSPAKRIQVDGHCDDRGTTQYNLALGKKRAEAVKRYLADLGAAGKVDTNTFGKEKPVCHEETEGCWAQNRRAEFTIER